MTEFNAKVTNSGRVTIPKKERRNLNIKDGDMVRVSVSKLVAAEEA